MVAVSGGVIGAHGLIRVIVISLATRLLLKNGETEMVADEACGHEIHTRGTGKRYGQNEKRLSKKQAKEIHSFLDTYLSKHGVTPQSLVEELLNHSVDIACDNGYDTTSTSILPFANALALIMNHAQAHWFDGASWN